MQTHCTRRGTACMRKGLHANITPKHQTPSRLHCSASRCKGLSQRASRPAAGAPPGAAAAAARQGGCSARLGVGGDLFDELFGEVGGVAVEQAHPAQALQAPQLAQQLRQAGPAAHVLAVPARVGVGLGPTLACAGKPDAGHRLVNLTRGTACLRPLAKLNPWT
jgi:hypothetical protein